MTTAFKFKCPRCGSYYAEKVEKCACIITTEVNLRYNATDIIEIPPHTPHSMPCICDDEATIHYRCSKCHLEIDEANINEFFVEIDSNFKTLHF